VRSSATWVVLVSKAGKKRRKKENRRSIGYWVQLGVALSIIQVATCHQPRMHARTSSVSPKMMHLAFNVSVGNLQYDLEQHKNYKLAPQV
jgi:hypothetical protein